MLTDSARKVYLRKPFVFSHVCFTEGGTYHEQGLASISLIKAKKMSIMCVCAHATLNADKEARVTPSNELAYAP